MTRGKGEGSIKFDPRKQLWVARIELPAHDIDDEGRPIRRRKVVTRKDKNALIREVNKIRAQLLESGGDMPTASRTTRSWFEHWLQEIAPKKLRPSTLRSYRPIVELQIIPVIGRVRLDKLTPLEIRRVIKRMEIAGASANYIRNTFSVMSASLRVAEREGVIPRNPCDLMDTPGKGVVQLEVLTQGEVVRLLNGFENSTESLLWATYMLTGARRGEVLGLEWDRLHDDHIDLSWQLQRITWDHGCGPRPSRGKKAECGFIRAASCPAKKISVPVNYDQRHVSGGIYWTRPKSKAGWRIIPLVDPLRTWLQEWQTIAPNNPHGLVFTDGKGGPIDPDDASEAWPRIREGVGIHRNVRLHDLRHTAIDMMYRAQVEESSIIRIFGHSTVQMSRSYRSAGNRELEVEAMKRFSASLGYPAVEA